MRSPILLALLLAACAEESPTLPDPQVEPGQFAAGERDGLCVSGIGKVQRAGFVAYGEGHANCSASGTIVGEEGKWALQPAGDRDCRIPLQVSKDGIALGAMTPACTYYCAPGLSFAGKSFTRVEARARRVADLAGDPLC